MSQNILVVIPTLNEAPHISGLVSLLLRGTAQHNVQLVVADGGSTDGTIEIVRQLANDNDCVKLLHNRKRLQSSGINLAVEQYGHFADILVRCDAHSTYPENYVSDLAASLLNKNAAAVVVPMDTIGASCLQKAIAWLSDSKVGSGGSAHRGGRASEFVDHGHHAAMQMHAFKSIRGYDESFSHNEDAEFDCRLRHSGGRIFLDAGIRIQYQPRSSLVALWRQYFNYGRGRSRTVRKHPGSLRLRQFLVPAHVAATASALILSALFPPLRFLLAWPLTYLLVLVGVSLLESVKRKSACGLLIAPAAAVMHTAWAFGFFWGFLTIRERAWSERSESVAVRN